MSIPLKQPLSSATITLPKDVFDDWIDEEEEEEKEDEIHKR